MSVGMSVHNFSTFQISQLWDLIETWGFREDLKVIVLHHLDDDNNNKEDKDEEENNNNNDNNNFLNLELVRDLGFLQGPQGQSFSSSHPDDDNNNKEDKDKEE